MMSKRSTLWLLTVFIILTMLMASTASTSSQAAGPTETPTGKASISAEITGTIQSISSDQITLTDGTVVDITTTTSMPALQVGQVITITVTIDGDALVATSIRVGLPQDDGGTATSAATSSAIHGKGKGKGKGAETRTPEATDSGHGKGKGKGKGAETQTPEATDSGHGKGNGKGKGNESSTPEAGDRGGKSTQAADCLSNTKQPVALQLSKLLGVAYQDIMILHCQGNGFGEIAMAYYIAQHSSLQISAIFVKRATGEGCGQIATDAGLSPSDIEHGIHLKGTSH